jgi:HK97 family phage major capsid protein
MTNLELIKDKIDAAGKEMRSALDAENTDEVKKVTAKLADLRAAADAEIQAAETRASLANVPNPAQAPEQRSGWKGVADQLKGLVEGRAREGKIILGGSELRAITANGAGYNTVPGVVKALVDGGKLRPKVSVFTGPNSQTIVPVFAPHMAVPVGTAPGATGTSSDSTAVLAGKALTLKPWYSTLAVSMDALISTDIESYLPGIFEEAFGSAIDKAILVGAGTGSDALGVFIASSSGVPTGSDLACAAAGTPKWVDVAKMALTVIGTMNGPMEKAAIVMHPNIMAPLLAETTTATDPYKMEYLTQRTVLGIPVILSSYALTTLTANSYVAVGGYFSHYGLAVAQEVTIDQIKTVGSDNVTFQSFMYMQGNPLVGSSFVRLKTV